MTLNKKKIIKKGKKYSGFHVIYGWTDHLWGDGDDEGDLDNGDV